LVSVKEEGGMEDPAQKLGGGADEGGKAEAATDIVTEGGRQERVGGALGMETSAIGGADDTGREGGVHGAIETEAIGGEARSSTKIAIARGVDVYCAYDSTLKSMGKET
jgi:hypothetical protein